MISHLSPAEKKTKIVCTIGPASDNEETLKKMMLSGMNVARINCSHVSDYEKTLETIKRIRKLAYDLKRPIAIMMDLQGPKVRIGELSSSIKVEKGEAVFVTGNLSLSGKGNSIPVDYSKIVSEVEVGHRILIEDGKIRLRVIAVQSEQLKCECEVGGEVASRKGVNLPDSNLSLSCLTEKDIRDLEFAVKRAETDMVAVSFVRNVFPQNLAQAYGRADLPIVAKIETPQAVENIDEILKVAAGIMVARGDLAVETDPADVPGIQTRPYKESQE